jgi:hypothetical protein
MMQSFQMGVIAIPLSLSEADQDFHDTYRQHHPICA